MTVKLRRKNSRYLDLTPQQNYVVIGIEADALRLLNDQGRPYLYPARLFNVVDPQEPHVWLTEYGEDHERYSYPPSLNEVGCFEDFFEEKRKAVVTFWQVVNQSLAMVRAASQSARKLPLTKTRLNDRARAAQPPAAGAKWLVTTNSCLCAIAGKLCSLSSNV